MMQGLLSGRRRVAGQALLRPSLWLASDGEGGGWLAQELRQMDADDGASLTPEERRRLMRMGQACDVLDVRMLALDPLLALFWGTL